MHIQLQSSVDWHYLLALPIGISHWQFHWQLPLAFPFGSPPLASPLATGYYPSILRVEHPAARYKAVEGGTQEVEAQPSELRFFDKLKGLYLGRSTLHVVPASVCSLFINGSSATASQPSLSFGNP